MSPSGNSRGLFLIALAGQSPEVSPAKTPVDPAVTTHKTALYFVMQHVFFFALLLCCTVPLPPLARKCSFSGKLYDSIFCADMNVAVN